MANHFNVVPLGDVASVRSGFAFSSSDWADAGIPVVKIANVKDGTLVMDNCSFVSPNVAAGAGDFNLKSADILISMTGHIGNVAMVRHLDLPAVVNQRVGLFSIPDPARLDKRFLFYSLRSKEVRERIQSLGYGSVQPNVSPSLLHGVNISLPPLSEQCAIAHILGKLDEKIELNSRMNETLEAMAQALYKSWFIHFDPVRAKMQGRTVGLPQEIADLFPERIMDSELGEIPEGWTVGVLGDIATVKRNGVDPARVASDTPYIGLQHMPRQSIALTDWGQAASVSSGKSAFEVGDILFGKLRPYFHKVGIAPVDGLCSTDIVVLNGRMSNWSAFVLACVSSSTFVAHTSQTSIGTKMPRTSWQAMSTFELCRPTDAVAGAFQDIVSPMLRRLMQNVHESGTLAALRDALLPKLISGHIRVPDVERILETVA